MPAIDQRLGERAADGEARVERVERVLEHELRAAAEVAAAPCPPRSADRRAVEADVAAGRLVELEQQPAGRGLAAAGLAEQPDASRRAPMVKDRRRRRRARRAVAPRQRSSREAGATRENAWPAPLDWRGHSCIHVGGCLRELAQRAASPARQQAAHGRRAPIGGGSHGLRQRSIANGQRGAKRQPGGGSSRSGGLLDRDQRRAGACEVGKALVRPIV